MGGGDGLGLMEAAGNAGGWRLEAGGWGAAAASEYCAGIVPVCRIPTAEAVKRNSNAKRNGKKKEV